MTGNNQKVTGSVGLSVDEIGDKSEYDNLNIPYGVLNNFISTSDSFEHMQEMGMQPNFFVQARKASERRSPIIAISGPYRGVVLRVDSKGSEQAGSKSDLERIHTATNSPTSAKSTQFVIRVRIPELHPHLPIPKTAAKPKEKNEISLNSELDRHSIDNNIISMYPKFVGFSSQTRGTGLPKIGDIVIVDFTNRVTQQGGCYIGPLNSDHGLYPSTTRIVGNASSNFGPVAGIQVGDETSTIPAAGQHNDPNPNEQGQVATPVVYT
tara:strand:+ start:2483 stop:3280 length:798 start_codon:yes stop_codon:yes gene_type:complete